MTDRRPAAGPGRVRGVTALAIMVVVATVLACGCAAIPSSGTPQSTPAPGPQGGIAQGGVLVGPPQAGWGAKTVVTNFLLASSLAAHNYRVARSYLTPRLSASWHPGSEVTILSGEPQVIPLEHRHLNGLGANPQVQVIGQELATLSGSGQYIRSSTGAQDSTEVFGLQSVDGVYKISSLPPASSGKSLGLLLTSDLFHLVYTPRDLYYYANGKLLPDPVYVPIQSTDLASTLVDDLRHNPAGWLSGVARTYVPARASLTGLQVFPGPSGGRTAFVNITLPRGPRVNVPAMVAQLVCTLTSPAFSPPLFRAVRIKINGRLWSAHGSPQSLASYQRMIPGWRKGMEAYYLTGTGSIKTLTSDANRGAELPKDASASEPALSKVAVSPDGTHLAGIAGPVNMPNAIYTGDLGSVASPGLLHEQLKGSFSSLSWDTKNDLWIVGRIDHAQGIPDNSRGVFVLPAGQSNPLPVGSGGLQHVRELRVAPDGVRVAMIMGKKAQVWLAAASFGPTGGFSITQPVPLGGQRLTGVLTGVTSFTWYDEDHLLAVAGSGAASRLWEVPVDGDNPTSLGGEADITSVTAAGTDNPFYLGLTGERLVRVARPGQFSQQITAGQAPAYPG